MITFSLCLFIFFPPKQRAYMHPQIMYFNFDFFLALYKWNFSMYFMSVIFYSLCSWHSSKLYYCICSLKTFIAIWYSTLWYMNLFILSPLIEIWIISGLGLLKIMLWTCLDLFLCVCGIRLFGIIQYLNFYS